MNAFLGAEVAAISKLLTGLARVPDFAGGSDWGHSDAAALFECCCALGGVASSPLYCGDIEISDRLCTGFRLRWRKGGKKGEGRIGLDVNLGSRGRELSMRLHLRWSWASVACVGAFWLGGGF